MSLFTRRHKPELVTLATAEVTNGDTVDPVQIAALKTQLTLRETQLRAAETRVKQLEYCWRESEERIQWLLGGSSLPTAAAAEIEEMVERIIDQRLS